MTAAKVIAEIEIENRELQEKPLYFFSPYQKKMAKIKRVGIGEKGGKKVLTVEGDLKEDKILQAVEAKCRAQLGQWVKAKKYAISTKGINQEEVERIKFQGMNELAKTLGIDL